MKICHLKNLMLILLGNIIYALGVEMFILPSRIITGGTTGLGIAMDHYFGIPLHIFVLIFNTIMFFVGAFFLGKAFAITTLVSSFFYPFVLGILDKIPWIGNVTNDRMLATVCGGLMIGLAIGMVIRANASTGGMDIPPLVLNKKFGLPVSAMLYIFDFCILMFQAVFSDKEQIVYGILLVAIYTVVLDKVLLMGTSKTQVTIISDKAEEVNRMIHSQLDRGSTLVYIQTGYLKKDQQMILSVVSNRELPRLNQILKEIDPNAFMIIGHVNEVKGHGFSSQKIYIN